MKIDVKKMDIELEKLYKISFKPEEEWRILDAENLFIKQEIIGNGSHGTIHKGTYHGLQVAVEVLGQDEDINRKTKPEIDSIKNAVSLWFQLDHPNLIKCLGAITGPSKLRFETNTDPECPQLNNSWCIVSEYPHGCCLRSYLKQHHRIEKLSLTVVIQLGLDLARGLNYIHSKNIVHGDIKTENIVLYIDNSLKITNFGGVRIVEDTKTTENNMGVNGSDVFNFGACLWEIYNCGTSHSDLNSTPKIPKRCPTGLAKVMERCLDRDPSKRPSMAEVISMLGDLYVSKTKGTKEARRWFCF